MGQRHSLSGSCQKTSANGTKSSISGSWELPCSSEGGYLNLLKEGAARELGVEGAVEELPEVL